MTASNCSKPSECVCANLARSRRVKVACCRVMASSATVGLAMIRSPFSRAISRCSSSRSGFNPSRAMRAAAGPILRAAQARFPAPPRSGDRSAPRRSSAKRSLTWALQVARQCSSEIDAVPGADLAAKPILVHRAHGQHDMRMRLGPAVGAYVPMDIKVGDHAAGDELPLDKVARQFDSLALVEFTRDGELDLAGKLGVFPLLGRFDRIPQTFALPEMLGNAGGRHHLGMDDALIGKIVMAVEPLVVKA